jgi:hypothetical protein
MKLFKFLFALPLMLMIYISPASAEYSYQLVIPPGAENSTLFGINNSGKAVGNALDADFNFLGSFEYDMKKGVYTSLGETFDSIGINNPGVMVGTDFSNGLCTIRDKDGTLTYFYPPSWTVNSFCTGRGVNPDGKISGFLIDEFDNFLGFIYDSEYGTYEEFLPSWQTIAHGINAQGQNVGSVALNPDDAYPGSPPGRYAYLREVDGFLKYFAITQSLLGESRARGISENGLVSGFYVDSVTWVFKGYVTTLPESEGFESIVLTDDEIVYLSPCDPDAPPPPPPPGYVLLTDVFTSDVRNDGVVVGQCSDYYWNWDTFDWIPVNNYGLIATPVK